MAQPGVFRPLLEPHIRARGVRASARRAGIHHARLIGFLDGANTLTHEQIEALLEAFQIRLNPSVDQPIPIHVRRLAMDCRADPASGSADRHAVV